ncbi:energy transducer TonB [Epilithonimonas sp. UC225_85]|uniref:energy transducer TonB n=1 Tax=Epilithonimonas sp. UC225_85 TaxID=3350167 RepID=UPI0036D2CF4D
MKKTLLFLTLFFSLSVFSQERTQTQELVETKVDKAAEFPGGLNAFRNELSKKFDPKNTFHGSGTYQTLITFTIDENGSISQVLATGKNDSFNVEVVKTFKKIKTKWTPGMSGGNPVKTHCKFPFIMDFMN